MEMSNLKSHLEVKSHCVQTSTDHKNPPKLVPYRNDICVLDNCEAGNSSPPHLLPEVILPRTKANKVSASLHQNEEYNNLNVALGIEDIRSNLEINEPSSSIWEEDILSVKQTEGNNENRAPKSSSHASAKALSNAVLYLSSTNMEDELHLGNNMVNSKQNMPQLNAKLQKSSEVNSLVINPVKQRMKVNDKSKVIGDQSLHRNEDEPPEIIEIYSQKCTKNIDDSKLATEIKKKSNINDRRSHEDSMLISISKEKCKNISEEGVFSYPQCRLPKMLDLNNAQRVRSKSSGCVTTNLNQNEQGNFSSFKIQNRHYESAVNFDGSNEQMAKNICNDLVNKVVKKCDYKLNKWQPYCPSGNIWLTAHEEYKKCSQNIPLVKKQHIKNCNMQSILKSKQKLSKTVIPKHENGTKSDIHLLCLGPNELQVDISNETFQCANFSGKQTSMVGKDKNLATVEIIENITDKEPVCSKHSLCSLKVSNGENVNNAQFEVEKVGNCKIKSLSSLVEPHNNISIDNLMTVDSFGRNLLLGCDTSWPGNMEPSFSGGRRSYVSSVPNYWSELDEDEDDEEEDNDKGDEYLSLRQHISTGKEERDTIDGVEFLGFETERDMVEFTKIEQDIQCNSCCDQGTNSDDGLDMMDDSFNSCGDPDAGSIHQAIVPTKTKDITKIKGWRNKHFAVNNNPSHCISSSNSNGPYEDDDGFESLDVKIQDEVIVEEEPESSVETKENRDLDDQQLTSTQNPLKTNLSCDDEAIKSETKDDLLQTELNTDHKMKKAAFISDEAEKFFSEFVSPDIAFDAPEFKQEEFAVCVPTLNHMHLSPRLQKLPPRKPITFWRKGLKYKALAEKKMMALMAMKSNVGSSKQKLGRPRKKKRPRGRSRTHSSPSDLVDLSSRSLKEQLVSGRKFVSTSSYGLDPDYKYTWVAGKPIRSTRSKKQKLKRQEDQAQKFESSHISENYLTVTKSTEVLADKLDINSIVDIKTSGSAEIMQNMKISMKLQENEDLTVEDIQLAEEFPVIGDIKPTSKLQTLGETKTASSRALTNRKLYSTSEVKLNRNDNVSEENKSTNSINMAEQLESSGSSNLVKQIKSSGNKNAVQEISTIINTQSLKDIKPEKNPGANEQVKFTNISHVTEQQSKEVRVTANKLDVCKQKVEELEDSKSQIIEKSIQSTEKNEENKQDICNEDSSVLDKSPQEKRTQMVVSPCIGTPLHPVAIKTLMTVRSENTLIDETWARFAVSVVTSSDCLLAIAAVKNKIRESRKSSFTSRKEKHCDNSAKMKTRGIKSVNYREKTRVLCQSEPQKKETKIPISGVITRNRSAVLTESGRSVSEINIDEETIKPSSSKNFSALNEPCNEFSDVGCAKPKRSNAEETKKVSTPACSKQLVTSTRAYKQTSEKMSHMVSKPRKGKENVCSSLIESQKTSPIYETDISSSVRTKCATSATSNKEELKAIGNSTSDEKDSLVLKATNASAVTKSLDALIDMCRKAAVDTINDDDKSKTIISDQSSTLIETCTSLSSDEILLEHKTKGRGRNKRLPSPTQSPLTIGSENNQAILEKNTLFKTRSDEKNEIPLNPIVNSKKTAAKILDTVSDKEQCNIPETNSEEQKSLLSSSTNEKGHASLNEACVKTSSDKNGKNNKEHLFSSEIYGNSSNTGSTKVPERDSIESKSPSITTRKRFTGVNKLFNEEDGDSLKKYKIEENISLSSVKVVIRKLSTSTEMLAERKDRFAKAENSKKIDPASGIKDKDAKFLSANTRALRAVSVEEQKHIGTKILSNCAENKNNTSFSENPRASISENLNAEIHHLLEDMVNCVVCHEIQDLIIKDDPDGCSDSQLITSHSPKKHQKKTRLNRELSRLSANLIVMNEYEVEKDSTETEGQAAINCKNDFCRLGCICDSLLGSHISALPEHCGKPSCMFECSCSNRMISQKDKVSKEKFGDRNNSRLYRTAVHLLDQGSRHLSKVEKEFSRTVIHSGKETVVVGGGSISDGGRRRREIKLPERYRDYNVALGKEFAVAEFKMISTEPVFDAGSSDTYRTLPNYVEVQVNQTALTPARKKPKLLKGKLTLDQKMALLSERYGIKACSVRLMRLVGMDDVVPWCMSHAKYDCFCRGIGSRFYKKLPHSSLEKPPPLNVSKKDVNDTIQKSATEIAKVQKKSRNKAVKRITLSYMHSHDVELYSSRTKGITMNYVLRNKSHYFKHKMTDFKQQQQNTSDRKTMAGVVEKHKPDPLAISSENALTGPLNSENFPPIMEQTEFSTENVTQDEDIGFGKIISITTLKPEEFEKCGTLEEINEADAGDIMENEEPTETYNPEAITNEDNTEVIFEKMVINAAPGTAGCSFRSSVSSTNSSGKNNCYLRIAKLISKKKGEIRTLLKKGECSLNLSRYEKCAIQIVKWSIFCRKFRNCEVSIWIHKYGNISKILITEENIKPDRYSTNLHEYFTIENKKLPPLLQGIPDHVEDENEIGKNADDEAYGLFYCDGKNWELIGCMRKIGGDTSIKQEKESEMNYPKTENKEWLKETELLEENACTSVINATHDGLIDIKTDYDLEEQSSAAIFETDRTPSDFRNYLELNEDSSNDLSATSDNDYLYSHIFNSDDARHRKPSVIQTQNDKADSGVSNSALSDLGDDLALSMLLGTKDLGYETKNTKEDNAYSPAELIAFGNKNKDKVENLTLTKLLNKEDFKSDIEQNITNKEYELQLPKCSYPCRWYVFAIKTSFDALHFYKCDKSISFDQINEAIKIANKNDKTIRIPLGNEQNQLEGCRPKFGAYALPNIISHFFIGPYGLHDEIGFNALKSFNGMLVDTHLTYAQWKKETNRQEIKKNRGMWYYAVKREEMENYTDNDLKKTVIPEVDESKMKQTLTARSLEPHCLKDEEAVSKEIEAVADRARPLEPYCSTVEEAVSEQTEAMTKEVDKSGKSRRKQTLSMRSFYPNCIPSTKIDRPSTLNEKKEPLPRVSADDNEKKEPLPRVSADDNEKKESLPRFSADDDDEEEELDVITPCDVNNMVQEMKDCIQRNTTQYKLQGAAAMQTSDRGSTLGDSEAEFKTPPPPPPLLSLHQPNELNSGLRKTAVPIKLVPSIPSLGFISANMYHNKSIELINPFADYREAKVFKNLSNSTSWLTGEVKSRLKCFPEDLQLFWRVRQASQDVRNCKAFNPKVLNGTYILTEKGVIKMRSAGVEVDQVERSKKVRLHRSFRYLRRILKSGNEDKKLSKLDCIQNAVEEIKSLVKQSRSLSNTVLYLKQKRLNTFKHFCSELKDFTNEEKRSAMICLKNVMRRPNIPIVHLEDDDSYRRERNSKFRDKSRPSASVDKNCQSSDESSLEDYLSNDEADSDLAHKEGCSCSVCCSEAVADKVKGNDKENAVIISSDSEEDEERPLSHLLQNIETSKHGSLTKSKKDVRSSNTHGQSLDIIAIDKDTAKSGEEKSQQSDSIIQTRIDDKDSVSISIVRDDQPLENTEETHSNNTDIVTMTCVTQNMEKQRPAKDPTSQNRNLKVYEQNSSFTSTPEINEMKLISTELLHADSENNESIKEIHISDGGNQENAVLTNLQFDKEKDPRVFETVVPSAKHTMTNGATIGTNQQFLINNTPVTAPAGGICYVVPPLVAQRSGLSLAIGSKQAEQQLPMLKRVWVKENSIAQNEDKSKQTSSEPPQKVRIISAPEEWKGRLITTSAGHESYQNTNTTKVTCVNASGNIQTSQSLGSKTVNVPVLPALLMPNNKAVAKTGYHVLKKGGASFKIVQTRKKVDVEFPITKQSSPLPKTSSQMTITRPVRFLPAAALHSITDSAQQNVREGPKQVIKVQSLAAVERPNPSSQLKSVLINGQKVFVQNAEGAYPLLVASSNPGTSTLLNSEPVSSSVLVNKSECCTDSGGVSDTAKCSSQSTLSSAPKTVFVSSSNYSNVLKAEAMRTANSSSFSSVGSKAFWIKRPLNRPVMLKVVNTNTSAVVSSPPTVQGSGALLSVQRSDAPPLVQNSGASTPVQSSDAPPLVQNSGASTPVQSSDVQGRSNIFQAVSLKCLEAPNTSPNPEVSEDSDVVASGNETDSSNSEIVVLTNDTSVSQRSAEDKEPSDKCLKISTDKMLGKSLSAKPHIYKCITEGTPSKAKLSKMNSTEAKKNTIVKDGVSTRHSKVTVRTEGVTTRSSKKKEVKS